VFHKKFPSMVGGLGHGPDKVSDRRAKGDGGDDISGASAAYDQCRPPVDHGVVNLTGIVIALITW
jgi:hypothetical protein